MRPNRVQATLRHSDAATERDDSSPSKRRRVHVLMSDDGARLPEGEVHRCGYVCTPACHDVPPSYPWQNHAEEKSSHDQFEVMLHRATVLVSPSFTDNCC